MGAPWGCEARLWALGITSLKIPQGPTDFVRIDFVAASGAAAPQAGVTGTLISGVTKQRNGERYLEIKDPPDSAIYRIVSASDDNDGPAA